MKTLTSSERSSELGVLESRVLLYEVIGGVRMGLAEVSSNSSMPHPPSPQYCSL